MRRETCDHDVVADFEDVEVWCRARDAPASGLQDDVDDIAGDENPCVQLWAQTTELRSNGEADPGQRSINCSSVKGWSEREQDHVHFEA